MDKLSESKSCRIAGRIKQFLAFITESLISIYLILILLVLPFYCEEGFIHIGTAKSVFFRQWSARMGRVIFPVLVLYLIAAAIFFVIKNDIFVRKDAMRRAVRSAWKNWRLRWSVTDSFVALYGVSLTLSYWCTLNREEAWMGRQGWYMGFFPQMTLVVTYFLVTRLWRQQKWLLTAVLPASGAVFALGVVNRFGIYPIDMKLQDTNYISTIGNINWYCGYLTAVFFGSMMLYWQADWQRGLKKGLWQNGKKFLLLVYIGIGFATLVTQGSSSGILAMAAVWLTMFWFSAYDGKRMQAFWEMALMFSGVCLALYLVQLKGLELPADTDRLFQILTGKTAAIVMTVVSFILFIVICSSNYRKSYPAKGAGCAVRGLCVMALGGLLLFVGVIVINTLSGGRISDALGLPEDNSLYFSPLWGSRRGATWRAAVMCFEEQNLLHKLVGVGPDCMSAFLYGRGSQELVAMVNGVFGESNHLTNAHNEWLTVLVNTGLFGMVSYVGIMVSAMVRFLKRRHVRCAAGACGLCILAYTVNNIFSFQQSMNVTMIFILLAVGEQELRRQKQG